MARCTPCEPIPLPSVTEIAVFPAAEKHGNTPASCHSEEITENLIVIRSVLEIVAISELRETQLQGSDSVIGSPPVAVRPHNQHTPFRFDDIDSG